MDSDNSIVISAVLVEKKELCYTPAGIAVFEARCHYAGQQFEAGAMRKIEFDFTVMSFADTAARRDKVELGKTLDMKGFIAQRSLRSSKLTVHITEFKIRS